LISEILEAVHLCTHLAYIKFRCSWLRKLQVDDIQADGDVRARSNQNIAGPEISKSKHVVGLIDLLLSSSSYCLEEVVLVAKILRCGRQTP